MLDGTGDRTARQDAQECEGAAARATQQRASSHRLAPQVQLAMQLARSCSLLLISFGSHVSFALRMRTISSQVKSSQVKSSQVKSSQVNASQRKSTQVK